MHRQTTETCRLHLSVFSKVCVDLQCQLRQAQLKKEETERELRELNSKTSREKESAAQVPLHCWLAQVADVSWV